MEALGLGHAVLCARHVIGDEPFAVLLPDDLFDGGKRPGIGQLVDVYAETGLSAVGVMEVPKEDTKLYGIVGGDDAGKGRLRAREVVEKPDPAKAPSRLAIVGRYVLSPEIWNLLANGKPGVGGEIQLTDSLLGLAKAPGMLAVTLEGNRYDAGTRVGFIEANLAYALKRKDIGEDVRALLRRLSQ
jgi:UTP--glucose-1-phosphate uridylyltransferase